jgi:hypothetical protein
MGYLHYDIMTAWHDQYRSLTLFATRACTAAQQGIVANICPFATVLLLDRRRHRAWAIKCYTETSSTTTVVATCVTFSR